MLCGTDDNSCKDELGDDDAGSVVVMRRHFSRRKRAWRKYGSKTRRNSESKTTAVAVCCGCCCCRCACTSSAKELSSFIGG